MDKPVDISIVVPCHNEEKRIEGCIRALLALDYPKDRYEILMVDNNSTDASVEIVRRYPEVRLLSETMPGDFAARNKGVSEARGEIIAFTDSDTAPYPDWLRTIVDVMGDPGVQVIIGGLKFNPRSPTLRMLEAYEEEKAGLIFSSRSKEIYFGYTCNMIVRAELFEKLGPFPPVYRNSDVVFVRRVVDAHSCDAVIYSKPVSVLRLEVNTPWSYYGKMVTYGRDYNRYGKVAAVRPLNSNERMEIFRRTVSSKGYSSLQAAYLFAVLGFGAVCYEAVRRFSRPGSA